MNNNLNIKYMTEKEKQSKSKRGPIKSSDHIKAIDIKDGQKRKRGRPRKSETDKKTEHVEPVLVESPADLSTNSQVFDGFFQVKRKRGRPRKDVIIVNTDSVSAVSQHAQTDDDDAVIGTVSGDVVVNVGQKRKRGRPRKNKALEEINDSNTRETKQSEEHVPVADDNGIVDMINNRFSDHYGRFLRVVCEDCAVNLINKSTGKFISPVWYDFMSDIDSNGFIILSDMSTDGHIYQNIMNTNGDLVLKLWVDNIKPITVTTDRSTEKNTDHRYYIVKEHREINDIAIPSVNILSPDGEYILPENVHKIDQLRHLDNNSYVFVERKSDMWNMYDIINRKYMFNKDVHCEKIIDLFDHNGPELLAVVDEYNPFDDGCQPVCQPTRRRNLMWFDGTFVQGGEDRRHWYKGLEKVIFDETQNTFIAIVEVERSLYDVLAFTRDNTYIHCLISNNIELCNDYEILPCGLLRLSYSSTMRSHFGLGPRYNLLNLLCPGDGVLFNHNFDECEISIVQNHINIDAVTYRFSTSMFGNKRKVDGRQSTKVFNFSDFYSCRSFIVSDYCKDI